MADDGSSQSATVWPLVKFAFNIKMGDTEMIFQEVTGLDTEDKIEYRGGNSNNFAAIKMPGIKKYEEVTLKKGVAKDSEQFLATYSSLKAKAPGNSTVIISLLDENNNVAMTWQLANATIAKMSVTDMTSANHQAMIGSMVLTHEGLTILS